MTSTMAVTQAIESIPANKLIFASKLFHEQLRQSVTEEAYYQTLTRMCKAGALQRIAKGTYYRPKKSKYGIVPLPQKEIVAAFTEPDAGIVVGYTLYNELKISTQVPKTIEALSSRLDQRTRKIGGISLRSCELVYTPEVKTMIAMLEVLQNFSDIQDLDYSQFIRACKRFSQEYQDETFEKVYQQMRYQKRTISFARCILSYYGVPNHLNRHLSDLSSYKHPTMEEIYEAAYFS